MPQATSAPEPIERPPGPREKSVPPSALRETLEKEGHFDIVVAINTKNVETTIIHVLNIACSALAEHFPTERTLVVVIDGGSTDQTRELAAFYPAPRGVRKLVVPQHHGPGKGNGFRTAFEIVEMVDAQSCACIDGDLVSIRTSWIDHLLRPVASGLADLVVPYYLRHKWDGVITNHLCYPFNVALYGSSVRQPIGGDYSFSRRCIDLMLEKRIPPHFGVDLFLSTTAIAEGLRTQEAPLGIKVHASTAQYTDPKRVLSGMYHQVVGTMLELAARHEAVWRRPRHHPLVLLSEVTVPYYARLPTETKVNEDMVRSIYREGCADYGVLLHAALPDRLHDELLAAGDAGLPVDLWARVVFHLAAWHVAQAGPDAKPDEDLIAVLGALGMGRFLHYVGETRDLSLNEANRIVRTQAEIFSERVPEFIARVDELRTTKHATVPRR